MGARELRVAIVARFPIRRGTLSGTLESLYDFPEGDFRSAAPRFSKENFPKNLKLVDEIVAIAKEEGCPPTQLTLAWLLAQADAIISFPRKTNPKRSEWSLHTLGVKVSKDEEQEIRKLCEEAEIRGGQHPEMLSKTLYADTPML